MEGRGEYLLRCLDMNQDTISYAVARQQDHSPLNITSMECVGASSLLSSWLIIDQKGKKHHVDIPAPSTENGMTTLSAIEYKFACESTNSDIEIAPGAASVTYSTTGGGGVTTLSPREGLHAASAGDSEWRLWKRSSRGIQPKVLFTGAPAPTSTVAIVERPLATP